VRMCNCEHMQYLHLTLPLELRAQLQAWMTERGMNTSTLSRFFWQQLTSRVFFKLNRTIGGWAGIVPGRGPNPADLPSGSFGNAWHTDYHQVSRGMGLMRGGRVHTYTHTHTFTHKFTHIHTHTHTHTIRCRPRVLRCTTRALPCATL
jgi:hypothetical protein